ncbi:TIGR00725 family protein [Athalassotoga sp.]|uniref:TIGR00725 family protein n=1 Tax=Athalassotoga sp. TaxID=2022597 RepID=UPI003D00D950
MKVAVIGHSGHLDKSTLNDLCEDIGYEIAKHGHVIVNGGTGGVMEAVSRGAKKAGGIVVGMLSGHEKGNDYLTIEIEMGFDASISSVFMMYNADAVISIGGRSGTALELFAAYLKKIPIILMAGTGGWTDRMINDLVDGKYFDENKIVEVKIAQRAEEVMEIVSDLEKKIISQK